MMVRIQKDTDTLHHGDDCPECSDLIQQHDGVYSGTRFAFLECVTCKAQWNFRGRLLRPAIHPDFRNTSAGVTKVRATTGDDPSG